VPTIVALIPAKGTSLRVAEKNIRPLAGHPLLAYTIGPARETGLFTDVVVSTESPKVADIATRYGATVVYRPAELALPHSLDIEWVLDAMADRAEDAFAILRPTSPFRTVAGIKRAWRRLLETSDRADSIRAVERCRQHPAKMWHLDDELLRPVLAHSRRGSPAHSMPYQLLPEVWVQNSSLEMAWRHVLDGPRPTISGERIAPFFTEGTEGFSIDYPQDFDLAEWLIARRAVELPAAFEAVH
jgi:CMP-N,N'-diacetyllegionaminic acid synthase